MALQRKIAQGFVSTIITVCWLLHGARMVSPLRAAIARRDYRARSHPGGYRPVSEEPHGRWKRLAHHAGDPFADDPSRRRTRLSGVGAFPSGWTGGDCRCRRCIATGEYLAVAASFRELVMPDSCSSEPISLVELHGWRWRGIGYTPYFSEIGQNADCPDHLSAALLGRSSGFAPGAWPSCAFIGHSLGRMLPRSVARASH